MASKKAQPTYTTEQMVSVCIVIVQASACGHAALAVTTKMRSHSQLLTLRQQRDIAKYSEQIF